MASKGRKLIPIDADEVARLAAQGLSQEQIAQALGINWKTLALRIRRFAEFKEAIKNGQTRGVAKVSNALFENAMGGNVAAQIFYLKNRDPENWSDKQKLEADVTTTVIKHFENEKEL